MSVAETAMDERMPTAVDPADTSLWPTVPTMRQLPLDLGHASSTSLDDFAAGRNHELLCWLRAWPDSAQPGAPTYLWGPRGCGKTRLLQGLAHHALSQGWHVLWLGTTGFQSWETESPEAPTLVLLDDCESLDAQQQHWAFNLFIESAASLAAARQAAEDRGDPEGARPGMAIVAAGRVPPVDLPVRDDLRTRLGWGLVFSVEPLDDEGVREALLSDCRRRGLKLAEGVLPYILTHFSRDLGFLMGLLDRLDRYALAEQRVVTVPLLKQMLAQEHA
ncbi:MAG TPA: DnaA regulatory inactivator Hda [Aquabacterium sp.]|uniref:HdaA/DnaA family protein n=1 Tax=Aquabacterium sp. TaxID=1872578 RepID=UPI002E37A333|nr:DnaA regulatory inactivator Hda [Aquabacterium sp.]HEX5371556.1 DnaA regulatory inactivator Hda [Aquabacterium sp.]